MKKSIEKSDLYQLHLLSGLESIPFRKPSGLCTYADGGGSG
ncbi:MAG: hypothetical protein ACLTDX_16650 [[Clostridium] innocuum]